jgi:hypothetical protein
VAPPKVEAQTEAMGESAVEKGRGR